MRGLIVFLELFRLGNFPSIFQLSKNFSMRFSLRCPQIKNWSDRYQNASRAAENMLLVMTEGTDAVGSENLKIIWINFLLYISKLQTFFCRFFCFFLVFTLNWLEYIWTSFKWLKEKLAGWRWKVWNSQKSWKFVKAQNNKICSINFNLSPLPCRLLFHHCTFQEVEIEISLR